ncbi:MAG: antibiotic biosynthesis monooxygenase [Anaerolineae bacterium]
MYAQVTKIRVPLGTMSQFRRLLNDDYLPTLRQREGYLGAMLLEQVDDSDFAELIVIWESHQAVEAFASTGSLASSIHALGAYVVGVSLQRQSYIVTTRDGAIPIDEAIRNA